MLKTIQLRITAVCIMLFTILAPQVALAGNGNFGVALEQATDTSTLNLSNVDVINQIEDQFTGQGVGGSESIRDFIVWVGMEIAVPVLVFAGIIVAIIGFYKLMNSNSTEESIKANKYILWGFVGVMVMLSASYLADQLVGVNTNPGEEGIVEIVVNNQGGGAVAQHIYDTMFYPFLEIFIYIILGVLFIFAIIHAFNYIFSAESNAKSKSVISVVYAALGIIIIILAKSLVEAIYGQYDQVVQGPGDNVGQIGEGFFNNPDYEMTHIVLNWALGLVTFIVAIIIIFQGYKLLTSPNNAETLEKMKKNFGYIFLGIVILGTAYLLVNVFIIQG